MDKLAQSLNLMIAEVEKGGSVSFEVYKQQNGLYCSVAGLGVRAGGYKDIPTALQAWVDAKELLND